MKIDLACIIDDDPIFVYGAKRIMELNHFCESFLIFNNGKDAFDYLEPVLKSGGTKIPEIILLDLNMPIMDGWQFLEHIVQIPTEKKLTIYIVTSSIDPHDINKAKEFEGVSNYVVKPITFPKLQQLIEQHQ